MTRSPSMDRLLRLVSCRCVRVAALAQLCHSGARLDGLQALVATPTEGRALPFSREGVRGRLLGVIRTWAGLQVKTSPTGCVAVAFAVPSIHD